MTDIATSHHAAVAWRAVMVRVRLEMQSRQVHAAQTVILVPYAQLMQEARKAWLADANGTHFVPRFETTQNWTKSLGGFLPVGDDLRLDAAVDVITAASLLARAGLGAHQTVLAQRLMEAAWSLAHLGTAVAPSERAQWGVRLAAGLGADMDAPVLALEAAVARIALAWVANSSFATDVLFAANPALLLVLEGFQTEPLARALQARLGERGVGIALNADINTGANSSPAHAQNASKIAALHAAQDAEDEAQTAAACVLNALARGHCPVALVALDRVLTRRVRAMLEGRGIQVRDETGWKLSTTRAAATLMSLLRASAWNASTDAVLDWLKNAPAFGGQLVTQAETVFRKAGLRDWSQVPSEPGAQHVGRQPVSAPLRPDLNADLIDRVNQIRNTLQQGRPLAKWLVDLRAALQGAGQWADLLGDVAGQAVLDVLRLRDGAQAEFAHLSARMSATEFTGWLSQTLEAESFMPTHPEQEQVVILPLSQLLGRPLPAVVMPGCDEVHLPVSPEPTGPWTPRQRDLLGLPSRSELAIAARQAWQYALDSPQLDMLWRQSEGGERLVPSGFVQELLLQHAPAMGIEPRFARALQPEPATMPRPQGKALPVTRLSASAYEDLRRCPYRFFALRQLRLQESDELDVELGKRDFGNWLHCVLKHFHETLNSTPALDPIAQTAMINRAAEQATVDLGLSQSEFLPFAASWPRVRAGYLQWLAGHQATGAVFLEAEAWKEMPLGALTLVGKIDRVDKQADGHALVIDYKTEARTVTSERIKSGLEDTQLAFYAALLNDDTLAGAYVNVGEKEPTKTYAPPDIVVLRDQLIEGVLNDMGRIADGAGLPAMGEGQACEFCAARGLCRKDFWT
jgi:ATP-dependent helicase/nuclease subunit B